MLSFTQFKRIFQQIQVVRPPQHRLATFGVTSIEYHLVTDVTGLTDRARLRVGRVTAEKPALITPESLRERFSGFGPEATEYSRYLVNQYGEALRGLEYQFRNEPVSSRVELKAPDSLVQQLVREFDRSNYGRQALIRGTDKMWELSVMKFIVEETFNSFSGNIQELQERGFFNREDHVIEQRQREIKNLFQRARYDKSLIQILGRKLREYDLFEQFQDDFFRLLHK